MNSEKDYTSKGWIAVTALIAVLVGVSFIPPQTLGGVALRRANILSDLIRFEEAVAPAESQVVLDEEEYHIDMEQVVEQIIATDSLPREVQTSFTWNLGRHTAAIDRGDSLCFDNQPRDGMVVIEDFDTTGYSSLSALYAKLLDGNPVRIAVLGDSFIEGDILTADLRERLQTLFGGSGAGFAPMASPLTGFRRTVKTQSKGWTAYNIMQYRTTPAALRDHFYISGWVCQPAAGAQTRWECTDARQCLDPCSAARVLFVSRNDSRVEVVINDTLPHTFTIEGDKSLRQIEIDGAPIHSLAFRVLEGADGMIGYGALLEGGGVGLDNYSVRSNNGQAMFRTSPTINAQANTMLGYDLIVLQYGLNIMQQGIHNYANYGEQIEKMIAYVRQCFPTAGILVLGVSDRSVRTDSGFQPMDAVPHMIRCQRAAAAGAGAAFWDTAAAMHAMGGMERFVDNGWAGKDYTHINYAGGRQVAYAVADAIAEGVRCEAERREREKLRKRISLGIADSLRDIREELFTPITVR